jgi:hypothetical protein
MEHLTSDMEHQQDQQLNGEEIKYKSFAAKDIFRDIA